MKEKSKTARAVQILIVDDHPVVREGLARVVAAEPDLEVCAEAATVAEAWAKLEEARPDVAVVDLSLPGPNGMELIKNLHVRHPEVPVLVLSMHDEMFYAERTLRAGARGYLMKQEPAEKIVEAIRMILKGELYVSPKISARILKVFLASGTPEETPASPARLLTNRELQVYELIGQGNSTQQVADRLHLGIKTIETYRAHIKRKLGLAGGNELVHHAVRWVEGEAADQPASASQPPHSRRGPTTE